MKEKLKLLVLMVVAVAVILGIGFFVYNAIEAKNYQVQNPVATFEIQDYGTIKVELYPEYAPNTVSNFIALINAGYYNDKVISGKDDMCLYMARGKDAEDEEETESEDISPKISLIDSSIEADSDGDYKYEIDGEFLANGFEQNTMRHEKGVLSLNRADYSTYGKTKEGYNSGSAQFSIMMSDEANLNGVYCAFGKVTEGFDVLENIYNNVEVEVAETSEDGEEEEENSSSVKDFTNKPVITNASVDTFGVDYGMPETHEAFDIQSYINELYSKYYSN